jgi:hypothetical protein
MDETCEIELWGNFEVDKSKIKNKEDKQIKERKEKSLLLINKIFNEVKPISNKPNIGIYFKVIDKTY